MLGSFHSVFSVASILDLSFCYYLLRIHVKKAK